VALIQTCNATNNTYFFLLPSNVSAGLFRTCLPFWRKLGLFCLKI